MDRGEKKKAAQSSRHSTISLNLSAIQAFLPTWDHSSISRPLGLRSGARIVVLILFPLQPPCCSHFLVLEHLLVNVQTKTDEEFHFEEEVSVKADSLTCNRCGNQRYPKKRDG